MLGLVEFKLIYAYIWARFVPIEVDSRLNVRVEKDEWRKAG